MKGDKKVKTNKPDEGQKVNTKNNSDFEITPQTLSILNKIYGIKQKENVIKPKIVKIEGERIIKPEFDFPEFIWSDEQKRNQLWRKGKLTEWV